MPASEHLPDKTRQESSLDIQPPASPAGPSSNPPSPHPTLIEARRPLVEKWRLRAEWFGDLSITDLERLFRAIMIAESFGEEWYEEWYLGRVRAIAVVRIHLLELMLREAEVSLEWIKHLEPDHTLPLIEAIELAQERSIDWRKDWIEAGFTPWYVIRQVFPGLREPSA